MCIFFIIKNLYVAHSKSDILSKNKSCILSDDASTISWQMYVFKKFHKLFMYEKVNRQKKYPHWISGYNHYICYEYI